MSVSVQAVFSPATAPAVPSRRSPLAADHRDRDQLKDLHPRPSLGLGRRPLSAVPSATRKESEMPEPSQTRALRASFLAGAKSTNFATACANIQVLSRLLRYLSWKDFHALSRTSRAVRHIFLEPNVKETVLARFVSGYRKALRARDRRLWEDSIRMNYTDLGLLIAASDTPLHRYPMHSLSILSSELPTWEQMQTTKRLQAFARIHSRVVLLLQNLVHSSSVPTPSDLDAPLLRPSESPSQTGLRELTFPAPLSYGDLSATKGRTDGTKSRSTSESGDTAPRSSSSSVKLRTSKLGKRHSKKLGSEYTVPELETPKPKRDRSSISRFSIFGIYAQRPLPQPAPEPEALKYYSGRWRRSYYAPPPSEDGVLKPPKRRFISSRYSSASSLGSSPSPSSSKQDTAPNGALSLHGLHAATKRNRAPILRVFVPCSELTDDVITACEDQLVNDGLWDHLSVGDVVCNFGYVPLTEDVEENGQEDRRRWLVFTGDQLQIYHPIQPPPISGALNLPSPFYYTHILPNSVNPRLRLVLPQARAHYTLVSVMTRITCSNTPGGYARVKTFAWLASFEARPSLGSPMNSGWAGEWVLQGEGTPEGKIALQHALRGAQEGEHEYEIVLDKSGGGRLWLRMIASASEGRRLDRTDSRMLPLD